MGWPVVTVASGGLPVVDVTATTGRGAPVTEATNKFGRAVTKVTSGGIPVAFETLTVWPPPVNDPLFSSVKLLMGFNGANASTGAPGMTDESGAAHGTSTALNGAAISTAQSFFGGSSLSLNGSTQLTRFSDSADYDLSNGPFTIECWIRPTSVTGTQIILGQWDIAPDLGWVFFHNAGVMSFNLSTTGSDTISQLAGGTVSIGTWYAVCVDFDGTKYRMYVNGAMTASSTTLRTIFNSVNSLAIGASSISGGLAFNGFIDELRLTKGVARYANDSGYTVAISAFPRS